jgi:ubiquinone/menaquinone biosynthesis C-methylase UbiE
MEDASQSQSPRPDWLISTVEKLLTRGGNVYSDDTAVLPVVGLPSSLLGNPELGHGPFPFDEITAAVIRDTAPIPHPHNRENMAAGSDPQYWLSGYATYRHMSNVAAQYSVKGGRFYDFGGATGRVFRHFGYQSESWEVWSSDFKPGHLAWNQRHFPPKFKVFLNGGTPPLPLPSEYFDLISAVSVFTHMDENETGWLLELRRLLRIGGIACVTIQDEAFWRMLKTLPDDNYMNDVISRFRPDIADREELPLGKTVIQFRGNDPYCYQTFYTQDWIYREWGRFFEVCDIKPETEGYQATVVLRRLS